MQCCLEIKLKISFFHANSILHEPDVIKVDLDHWILVKKAEQEKNKNNPMSFLKVKLKASFYLIMLVRHEELEVVTLGNLSLQTWQIPCLSFQNE